MSLVPTSHLVTSTAEIFLGLSHRMPADSSRVSMEKSLKIFPRKEVRACGLVTVCVLRRLAAAFALLLNGACHPIPSEGVEHHGDGDAVEY
jgi:hypothetical protein